MPSLLPDPPDFHPWTFTEWIEATMMLEELSELSRTSLSESFPAGMAPNEDDVEEMLAEVRRRSAAAPEVYPFNAEESRVVRRVDIDAVPYDFLLMLSLQHAPYRQEKRFEEINPAFELLAREALLRQLGDGAAGCRFAWPTRDDRPTSFREAVEWLAKRMRLEVGSLSDVDDVDNDGGVDVACWRSFGDGQPGHLCILGQCTVEIEYGKSRKVHDVEPNQWFAWIRFGRPPLSALIVPFVIPRDAKLWKRLSARCDLLLDRLRIAELLNPDGLKGFQEHAEMEAFVDAERTAISAASKGSPATARKDRLPRTVKRHRPVAGTARDAAVAQRDDDAEPGA